MKELITEEQAGMIVMLLSLGVTLVGIGSGFYLGRKCSGEEKKRVWAQAVISALAGPVIWLFWGVYNSIENYYGLDSLKALKINFVIALGLGVIFFFLYRFIPGWVTKRQNEPGSP